MNKEIKAGERIRAYRERNGWSVWDLAQKSGVEEKVIYAESEAELRAVELANTNRE